MSEDPQPKSTPTEATQPAVEKRGYGHPPKHSQFKPGQSGNPKGKPKGTKNLATILESEMNSKVTVHNSQGAVQKITKRELIIKKIIADAANGKASAQKQLLDLMLRFYKPDEEQDINRAPTPEEQAFIELVIARRSPK